MNGANSELSFYRADEGRTLEEGSSKIFDGAGQGVFVWEGFVEAEDTNILFSYRWCQSVVFWENGFVWLGEDIPADCWDFTRRVALSMQTTRTPVTIGSSVPEWPVFCTRRIRLIQATTSWELGRDGLSRAITPELRSWVSFWSGEER